MERWRKEWENKKIKNKRIQRMNMKRWKNDDRQYKCKNDEMIQ